MINIDWTLNVTWINFLLTKHKLTIFNWIVNNLIVHTPSAYTQTAIRFLITKYNILQLYPNGDSFFYSKTQNFQNVFHRNEIESKNYNISIFIYSKIEKKKLNTNVLLFFIQITRKWNVKFLFNSFYFQGC